MKTTITEALAELATIDKRLPKKAAQMFQYVARPEQLKDPLVKTGGSEKFIDEERQSYGDLLIRKINLRAAIARANAETMLNIDGREMSVADWLVWKRECYEPQYTLLNGLLQQVHSARSQARQVSQQNTQNRNEPIELIISLDEQALIGELDALTDTYGRLDGLLSLKNATTTIEV